jgi:hypothetical protein
MLLDQEPYCLVLPPVLGVVGAGAGIGVVVLPEVVPLPVVLPEVLPPMLPLEPDVLPPTVPPAPAPARLSRRQVSRSLPVRPTHFAGTSLDAPVVAEPEAPTLGLDCPLDWPTLGVSLAPVVLLPPLVEPDVPAPALAPVLPEAEPEELDWAIATEERARSAAAVAAVRVFNTMIGISSERV